MKGKLEFNLPEEQEEFRLALDGSKCNIILFNISQKLRSWLKYDHEFKSADEALEAVREYFWEEIEDKHIEIF